MRPDGFRFTELPEGKRVARKGGKGGGGGASPYRPQEYPNTLRSRAYARILEVLSEGPIKGMHTYRPELGTPPLAFWQSVILDGTPVFTNEWNFALYEGYFRYGYPGQDPVPGFPMSEAEVPVGLECKPYDPVVRRLSSPNINAFRVTLRFPMLYMTEQDGDISGTNVSYEIDYNIDNGGWIYAYSEAIWGKTMSPYERSFRINLGYVSASSIDIRVIRVQGAAAQGEANTFYWSSYTEIQDGMLGYDDTALFAAVIDAEDFPNVPQRAYLLDGLLLYIPNNYDPWNHSYAGDWNGGFKYDWTNNPAWVLYGLLTNERWGLGRYLDINAVDKWSFYQAAVWNDAIVPDGQGGAGPRWTCNCVINTRQDAWQVLTAVASSMMATLFFANGTVFCVQDRGGLPSTRLFGPADVVNGLFDYVGTDFRSRHTAVAVTWNDPEDAYKPAVELVQDALLVAQQGYKEYQLPAFGCTNRGQAIRAGRWAIYTSQYETEAVSFQVGLENADIRPGEVVAINDPGRAGARLAGRLLNDPDPNFVTLDKSPDAVLHTQGGLTLYLQVGSAADGQKPTIYACPVVLSLTTPAAPNRVQIVGKPAGADAGTVWLLTATNVQPTWWRVVVVTDQGQGVYQVLATEWDINKWYYVDYGWSIPEPPHSLIPSGPLQPPSDINYAEMIYLDASGRPQFGVLISWTASPDPRVARYTLELSGPSGDYRVFQVAGVTQEVLAMRQGEWEVRLRSFDNLGRYSRVVSFAFTPIGLTALPLCPEGFFITPQGGNMITLSWTPTGEIDVEFYWIKFTGIASGAVWDRATTSIARVDRNTTQVNTPARYGTYLLKAIDSLGQESVDWIEAVLEPQNTELTRILHWHEEPDWIGNPGINWHRSVDELWLPPPPAPEPIPPGVFPGDRGIALGETPTRIAVYDFAPMVQDNFLDFTGSTLPPGVTITRASTGWYFNGLPALTGAAANGPRFDHDPATAAQRGLLNEPGATNGVRNSSGVGAVAGSPGTDPTNWNIGTVTGLTRTIVGSGTEDGIPYVDFRYSGTAASGYIVVYFEAPNLMAAAAGQTWMWSAFIRTLNNTAPALISPPIARIQVNDSGGAGIWNHDLALSVPTNTALMTQRQSFSATLSTSGTAYVSPVLYWNLFAGPIDVTFRIGLINLVQSSALTSPIVTTTAAVTRAPEVVTLTAIAAPVDVCDVTIVRESGTTTLPSVDMTGGLVIPTGSPVRQVTLSPSFKGFDLEVATSVTMAGYVEGYGGHILGVVMAAWIPLASQDPLAQSGSLPIYTMASWVPLAIAVPLAIGSSGNWDAHIEARVSSDGVTWLDWFPLKSTVITAQKFEWRLVGSLYDLTTTLRATEARVLIEVPLRNIQGSDVVMDGTGHLLVTYEAPFLATPTVQITGRQSMAPGGTIVITESDRAHFKLEHRNSAGAATTGGSVDYFVQGYGGH